MKILILTSRFPYPIEKGDKLRIYHQIRELGKRHELILCSLCEEAVAATDYDEVKTHCAQIHLFPLSKVGMAWHVVRHFFSSSPIQVNYFYRRHIAAKIERIIIQEQPCHIYCQLIRMAEYVRKSDVACTIDYMDALSLGMKRRALHSSWWKRPILAREARQLAGYECAIYQDFQYHTIISAQDQAYLVKNMSHSLSSEIHIVANGVDTHYFRPFSPPQATTYELVFVGNMGYFPNVVAAKYLVRKILPQLKKIYPDIRLLLAGTRPSSEVKALGSEKGVDISGWMPDIRRAYASGKIFVAPLFTGSGQQNKILEAMAMGVVCITSPMVNRAIGARAETTILEAQDVESFVKGIDVLLRDANYRASMAREALAFVKKRYSWEASVRKLEEMWEGD